MAGKQKAEKKTELVRMELNAAFIGTPQALSDLEETIASTIENAAKRKKGLVAQRYEFAGTEDVFESAYAGHCSCGSGSGCGSDCGCSPQGSSCGCEGSSSTCGDSSSSCDCEGGSCGCSPGTCDCEGCASGEGCTCE